MEVNHTCELYICVSPTGLSGPSKMVTQVRAEMFGASTLTCTHTRARAHTHTHTHTHIHKPLLQNISTQIQTHAQNQKEALQLTQILTR